MKSLKLRHLLIILSITLVCRQLSFQKQVCFHEKNGEIKNTAIDQPTKLSLEQNLKSRNQHTKTNPLYATMLSLFESIPPSPVNATRQIKPTVLTNLIRREGVLGLEDIVMATHISADKLPILLVQLKYWKGPASVAVYVKSNSHIDDFFDFIDEKQGILHNASFHLVMEKTTLVYPHNVLRNVALHTIESDYFVALDVDFIPAAKNSYGGLVSLLQANHSVRDELRKHRRLFIIPAFELFAQDGKKQATEDTLPHSKVEVTRMIKNQTMRPFEKRFPKGHKPTNFPRWLELVEMQSKEDYYTISHKRKKKAFEPYVFGYRPGIPRYWEEFRGYGWNKISFFQECLASGYEFAVLCDFFCVHLNHPDPPLKLKGEMSDSNIPYWHHFKEYVSDMFPNHDM